MPSLRLRLGVLLGLAVSLFGCAPKNADITTVNLGEKVQVGPLNYNAFDTQWLVSLGEGANVRFPVNRFFLIHLNVVNGGQTDTTVPTLMLVDDAGQSYNEMSNGEDVPNWMGIVRRIHPGDSENGNIAFDVPSKHYRLRVSDEGEDRFAYVDIPLNFATQTPNMPPPASSRPSPPPPKP